MNAGQAGAKDERLAPDAGARQAIDCGGDGYCSTRTAIFRDRDRAVFGRVIEWGFG